MGARRKKRVKRLRLALLTGCMLVLLAVPALVIAGCASKPVSAVAQPDGTQTVKVLVKQGYHPGHIEAQAGKPLKIEFYRDEEPGKHSCAQDLEIPAENVKLPLPAREPQIVEIKPQPPGEMVFQCGMNMMKGKITFK